MRSVVSSKVVQSRGLTAAVVVLMAALVVGAPATALGGGEKVDFTVTVETDVDADPEVSERTARHVAEKVVDRIEQRLDAVGVKHHEIETAGSDVRIEVFGDYSPEIVRAVVIPGGRVEIRPVMVDSSPWLDVAQKLPEEVDLHNEPGSMDPDSFFLFASSPAPLHRAIELVSDSEQKLGVYPHEQGWRTLRLGPVLATHDEIRDAEMGQNPAGRPFVRATLDPEAAQQIRSGAQNHRARQLAFVVDGEVVAVEGFSDRAFSERVTIDPPEHLESSGARTDWAMQVAGRMAVEIPVQIAEFEE